MIRLLLAAASLAFTSLACADELPDRLTVATWNLEWFFDEDRGDDESSLSREQSAPGRDEWQWKLAGVAEAIAQMRPTILAVQEVENLRVMSALARELKEKHNLPYRVAFIEGNDSFTGQDVAILYRSGLVEYSCRVQSDEMFRSGSFYNISKHLFAEFEWGEGDRRESLMLLTFHLRATPKAADVRLRQMRLARHWIDSAVRLGRNVVVLGDLNTEETDLPPPPGSDLGILWGLATETAADDLFDLHTRLPAGERITHLAGKHFDRILVSRPLMEDSPDRPDFIFRSIRRAQGLVVRGAGPDADHFTAFWSIPQGERDLSDHYPLIAEFDVQ